MSLKKNSSGSAVSKTAFSFLTAVGIMAALSVITSAISYCTADPLSLVKPLSVAAIIIGAAISSFVCSKKFGKLPAIISSLAIILVMMTVGIVANSGKINTGALINYACYMATALLFSYLASRTAKVRRHKPKRF